MPSSIRHALTAQYGERSGEDAGQSVTPARAIADAPRGREMRDLVHREYLDTKDLEFTVGGTPVAAGAASCGPYRIKRNADGC